MDSKSTVQDWEVAIREVNSYFQKNTEHWGAISNSEVNFGEQAIANNAKAAGVDRLKSTERSISDLEIDNFKRTLATHKKYQNQDFSDLDTTPFSEILKSKGSRERILVQEARAALEPSEFERVSQKGSNATVREVRGMIDNSHLSQAANLIDEYAEQRAQELEAAPAQAPSKTIWEASNILDAITSAFNVPIRELGSLSPPDTPASVKSSAPRQIS